MTHEMTVIVERSFEEPTSFDVLEAEEALAWCSAQHRVTFLRSYRSLDRRTIIGVYRAPETDAVREVQRQGGIPLTRAWPAQIIGSPDRHRAAEGFATVIVERDVPEGITLVRIQELLASGRNCLEANRCDLLQSNFSIDRKRMVCIYQAPDAESVRRANRVMGLPVSRVWTASVHCA